MNDPFQYWWWWLIISYCDYIIYWLYHILIPCSIVTGDSHMISYHWLYHRFHRCWMMVIKAGNVIVIRLFMLHLESNLWTFLYIQTTCSPSPGRCRWQVHMATWTKRWETKSPEWWLGCQPAVVGNKQRLKRLSMDRKRKGRRTGRWIQVGFQLDSLAPVVS